MDFPSTHRARTYWILTIGLVLVSVLLRETDWQGSATLHTVMETAATLLAMLVGTMALVRYYTLKETVFLFVGAGFMGTAFLEGYHTIVTSAYFKPMMPSELPSLIPWSWIASRLFLSVFMVLSWLAWVRETRSGETYRFNERTVYLSTAVFSLASFLFFALVPLPRAYYPESFFGRPEEFIPALFFALALVGFLRKGDWKNNAFEHWLVLSLIIGLVSQTVFMSFSTKLFDFQFDAAHLLKKVSYLCVLTGLLISMSTIFLKESVASKALNEALERSEKALHELGIQKLALDQHAIVGITDPQGNITYANESFCMISKYSRQELIGKNHNIVNSGHHPKEFFLDLWRTISSGKVWRGEVCNRAKDRTLYWVQTTIVPLPELDGKLQGYISIRTDITERKLMEERILSAMDELERSNRELDAFAYIASHDLKEPLRGIHNYSQFLLEDYATHLDDEGCEKLETLKRLAQRMDDLIGTLLRFSRVGRTELEPSQVNVGDLAREARNALRVLIDESVAQVEIVADLPDVTCDPVLVGQVFQNLIGNAIKYSGHQHGQVEVGWNSDESCPVIHVRDDGIGIREKDFKSIFRIFKRLHGKNKYGGGLGAGLTFARKIVEHHGGHIWVESEFGEGSTFYFTLS